MAIQGAGKKGKGERIIDDNVVQPFRLEKTSIRGRVVRLGSVLQDIVSRHNYPAPVSYLLSETVTLCVLLSAMLKYDGIFTLQIKGSGPIHALVADATTDGKIRAYASFDELGVKKLAKRKPDRENNFFHLLGKGYVSFTVDQDSEDVDRYQGIVELQGESLMDSVQYYFDQSEQIKTAFRLAIHPQDMQWRSGAIMIQHMPVEGGYAEADKEISDEDWNRSHILMASCREEEILSSNLHSADVLYRLFHEEGVRIYPQQPITHACRCSREKIEHVILTLPKEETDSILEEQGKIGVTCEFCSREYNFSPKDVQQLEAEAEK
jgi:molecular chaperone Hsp33